MGVLREIGVVRLEHVSAQQAGTFRLGSVALLSFAF
jgi:hypothetical protein